MYNPSPWEAEAGLSYIVRPLPSLLPTSHSLLIKNVMTLKGRTPTSLWKEYQGHLVERSFGVRDNVEATFGKYDVQYVASLLGVKLQKVDIYP